MPTTNSGLCYQEIPNWASTGKQRRAARLVPSQEMVIAAAQSALQLCLGAGLRLHWEWRDPPLCSASCGSPSTEHAGPEGTPLLICFVLYFFSKESACLAVYFRNAEV